MTPPPVAARGQPLHEDLRHKIRAARIVHGDETHWRNDGQGAQLWYAENSDVAFFLVDPSRGDWVSLGQVRNPDDFEPGKDLSAEGRAPLQQVSLKDGGATGDEQIIWSEDTLIDLGRGPA